MITPVGLADRRSSLVRRSVIDSLLVVGLTSLATFVALVLFAQHGDIVLKAGFVAVGLFVGLRLLYNLAAYLYGDTEPGPAGARQRHRNLARDAPAGLLEMEGRVSLAMVSEFDYQSRLQPLVCDLAVRRLAAHRHIDLWTQPEAARACLQDRLWSEFETHPAVGDPRDRPGPTLALLRGLVDDLESI